MMLSLFRLYLLAVKQVISPEEVLKYLWTLNQMKKILNFHALQGGFAMGRHK